MAQQVEHVLGKDEVAGSNPANSSIKTAKYSGFFLCLELNCRGYSNLAKRAKIFADGLFVSKNKNIL